MICYIAKIYKIGWDCTTNQSPKGKRKTKTVNQDVVKEIGLMSYPGRSHGQGILVYFKISDSTLVAKNDYWTKDESVCLRFVFSRMVFSRFSLLWNWSVVCGAIWCSCDYRGLFDSKRICKEGWVCNGYPKWLVMKNLYWLIWQYKSMMDNKRVSLVYGDTFLIVWYAFVY